MQQFVWRNSELYFISIVLYFFILEANLWRPSLNLLRTWALRQEQKSSASNFQKYFIHCTMIHKQLQEKPLIH